jgi:VanZ family protein
MKKINIRILINWLLVCAYCSAVFILSSSASPRMLPKIAHADKVVHFIAFVILGILFFRAYYTLGQSVLRVILFTFISSTLFGALIEIHQYFLPYRSAEGLDIAADVAGCLTGIWICFLVTRRRVMNTMSKGR